MTAPVAASAADPLPAQGWYRATLGALGRAVRRGLRFRLHCLIFGHDDAFAREPRRLKLRCGTCGRETEGWPIGAGAPAVLARRAAPARRTAALATTVRVGPWTLRRRQSRGEARDRERQRLVAAASRLGS